MNGVKLTGLWKSQSKNGKSYLGGNLGPMARLLVFPNELKKEDRDPDYNLFVVPRENNGKAKEQKGEPGNGEDVPF
jgi:hypothetical protein